MLPPRDDQGLDAWRLPRGPEPSQQTLPDLYLARRRTQLSSRQRPAEGHRGARPCAFWRTGNRRDDRDTGFGEVDETRRTTQCEANCPCTSARGAEPEQGTGSRAKRQRCRTAVAGCTAECRQEHRRAIKTPSNMVSTPQKLLHGGDRFQSWCAQ